jgi:HD-GYP domain-containing protein (c-di-GMP phosphodiesterase class II)
MQPAKTTEPRHKEAVDVLVRLQALFKLAKFYEPNNSIFLEQINLFFSLLHLVLERDKIVQIDISQNSIFFNRTRVKFDFGTYHVYKFLVAEFQEREFGMLALSPGLTLEELGRFITFLVKTEVPREDPFEHIMNDFKAASFPHIEIGTIPLMERVENKERAAAKMYLLGISHLKEIFDRNREMLNFNLTKRWIQSMFNHIAANESFVQGLANTKNFDEYTLNHSVNVCVFSLALGRRMGLSRQELTELGISAFLHDLGKLDIPKEILDKPAKLDAGERTIIEKHSYLGAERLVELAKAPGIPFRAIQVALEHHSRIDMSGYPKYVRIKEISLFSKIVQIVDTFDAMTSRRVFRKKVFTKEEALGFMVEKSGIEFDPIVLKAFISMVGIYPVGSLVFLSSGEIGIVFANNPHASLAQRPKVKLIADVEGRKMDGPIVDLTDVDPSTRKFQKTIVKSLDPDKYGIQVSDYFLVRAL